MSGKVGRVGDYRAEWSTRWREAAEEDMGRLKDSGVDLIEFFGTSGTVELDKMCWLLNWWGYCGKK